jgi:hypothetical protein
MLKRLPVLLRNNLSFPEPGTCLPVVELVSSTTPDAVATGAVEQTFARPDRTRTRRPGAERMDDARYHRCQAELCLEIAELMSDPVAAKLLREAATRHLAEATANGKRHVQS